MGAVYKAFDDRLKRTVAIKHVLPHIAADEVSRLRLRREAQAAAGLSHPSIVQIFDIFEAQGFDWIVMEFVDGERLQDLIEAGRMGLAEAVPLCREIAEGLAEAHSKGIVHRDLKTENVMVTQAYHAKILDFGLAKNMVSQSSPESDEITDLGAIMGTGRAMSPEQAMGEEVDHRSDLFSLGTLIYETLTARSPFVGNSVYNTLAKVCSARHTPTRELNPHVPEELSNLVDRLLEKNPEHRPQSAREVIVELRVIEKLPLPQWGGTFPLGAGLPAGRQAEPASIDFLDIDPARLPPADRPPQASNLHDLARLTRPDDGPRPSPEPLAGISSGDDTPAFPIHFSADDPEANGPPEGTPASQELTADMGLRRHPGPPRFEATAEIPPLLPRDLPYHDGAATTATTRPPSGIHLRALLLLELTDDRGGPPAANDRRDFERKLRYLSLEFEALRAEPADPALDDGAAPQSTAPVPLRGLLLFERPSLAVRCARAFLAWAGTRGERNRPRLRAALGLGEVHLAHEQHHLEVSGHVLGICQELLSMARASQLLATEAVYGLSRLARREAKDQDDHESWTDHGDLFFRGLNEDLRIFALGLSEDDSRNPPRSAGSKRARGGLKDP